MFSRIISFFLSIILFFLSLFGINFNHNESEMTDTVYSKYKSSGGNEYTDELKTLFAGVKSRTPEYKICEAKKPFADDDRISALYFDGEEYNGKPAQIFAYMGFPENASPENPVPAMVLVHGGMGHACAEWVRLWVNKGYAAISIDGFGQHPAGGEYTGDESAEGWSLNPESHMTIDELRSADKPFKEQWFYYYITDIILANSLIRGDGRVKTDSVGLTGISWGGFASSVVIGYDDRFAFAVPVYGCGFLDQGCGVFSEIVKQPAVAQKWEPSLLIDEVKMPVMWICGDNDPFFSADSVTASAANAENGSLLFIRDLPHGQNPGAQIPEIVRFANEQNGIGNGNIKITRASVDGRRMIVSADIPDDIKGAKAYAYYRTEPLEYDGKTFKGEWKRTGGILLDGTANVKIPKGAKLFYISVQGKCGKTVLHSSTGQLTSELLAQKADVEKLFKLINASVNSDLASDKVGCAEILVNQKGERIFDEVYGVKNAEGDPLTKDCVYRIASMTKPVTAAALLIEAERGNIDIYADVSDYLDGYENLRVGKLVDGKVVPGEYAKNSVKVYQLVSHTSGIGSGALGEALYNQIPLEGRTTADVAAFFADKPLEFDPGTSQSYSTAAYDVAAAIIEKTSGMDFAEYIKVNIFDKLGMNDTTYEPNDDQWNRMVDIHNRTEDGKGYFTKGVPGCVFAHFPATYHCTGGGLASTAEDYIKFAEMLLNEGRAPDGTQVMSPESVRLMATPVVSDEIMPGSQKWGLGVRVITDDKYTLPKGSFGWSGAYGSHFWIDPENQITAVYMKNSSYDGGAGCATSVQFEKDVMASLK